MQYSLTESDSCCSRFYNATVKEVIEIIENQNFNRFIIGNNENRLRTHFDVYKEGFSFNKLLLIRNYTSDELSEIIQYCIDSDKIQYGNFKEWLFMLNMKLIINTDKQYWIKENNKNGVFLSKTEDTTYYYVIPEPENINTFENDDGSTRIVCEAKEVETRKGYTTEFNNMIRFKPKKFEKAKLLIVEKWKMEIVNSI